MLLDVVRGDLRLQRRYGIAQAGLVVAGLWVLLLRVLPPEGREIAAPLVVFGDLAIIGYFFVGALVLFEKAEGTLAALAVSPLRAPGFVAARAVSFTLLALALTLVLVGFGVGPGAGVRLGWLLVGVVLCSVTGVCVGVAVVAPFTSVSRYLLPAVLPLIVLGLPLLAAAGLLPPPAVALLPTGGAWLAIDAAFGGPRGGLLVAAVAMNVAWLAGAWTAAVRAHSRWLAVPQGSS